MRFPQLDGMRFPQFDGMTREALQSLPGQFFC
jgi:hypothetical protein